VARLLDGLDALLTRNRALLTDPEVAALHVELIAAEVEHEMTIARSAVRCARVHRPMDVEGCPSTSIESS
jgi:hypothetical protein